MSKFKKYLTVNWIVAVIILLTGGYVLGVIASLVVHFAPIGKTQIDGSNYYKSALGCVFMQGEFQGQDYYHKLSDINNKGFRVISCKYPIHCYATDGNVVLFSGEIMPGADPSTFEVMGDFFAKDANNVYSALDRSVVVSADASSFEQIDDTFYKDQHYVYLRNKVLVGEDPNTFDPNAYMIKQSIVE